MTSFVELFVQSDIIEDENRHDISCILPCFHIPSIYVKCITQNQSLALSSVATSTSNLPTTIVSSFPPVISAPKHIPVLIPV